MSEGLDDRDYDVGYGKPPKRTQFKKGKSGNPKGRPKGAKGVKASLKRELESKITIQEGGRCVKVSKAEALSKRMMASALKGDTAVLMQLLKIDADLFGDVHLEASESGTETPSPTVDKVDFEILRDFLLQSADDDVAIEDRETDDRTTDTEEWDDDDH